MSYIMWIQNASPFIHIESMPPTDKFVCNFVSKGEVHQRDGYEFERGNLVLEADGKPEKYILHSMKTHGTETNESLESLVFKEREGRTKDKVKILCSAFHGQRKHKWRMRVCRVRQSVGRDLLSEWGPPRIVTLCTWGSYQATHRGKRDSVDVPCVFEDESPDNLWIILNDMHEIEDVWRLSPSHHIETWAAHDMMLTATPPILATSRSPGQSPNDLLSISRPSNSMKRRIGAPSLHGHMDHSAAMLASMAHHQHAAAAAAAAAAGVGHPAANAAAIFYSNHYNAVAAAAAAANNIAVHNGNNTPNSNASSSISPGNVIVPGGVSSSSNSVPTINSSNNSNNLNTGSPNVNNSINNNSSNNNSGTSLNINKFVLNNGGIPPYFNSLNSFPSPHFNLMMGFGGGYPATSSANQLLVPQQHSQHPVSGSSQAIQTGLQHGGERDSSKSQQQQQQQSDARGAMGGRGMIGEETALAAAAATASAIQQQQLLGGECCLTNSTILQGGVVRKEGEEATSEEGDLQEEGALKRGLMMLLEGGEQEGKLVGMDEETETNHVVAANKRERRMSPDSNSSPSLPGGNGNRHLTGETGSGLHNMHHMNHMNHLVHLNQLMDGVVGGSNGLLSQQQQHHHSNHGLMSEVLSGSHHHLHQAPPPHHSLAADDHHHHPHHHSHLHDRLHHHLQMGGGDAPSSDGVEDGHGGGALNNGRALLGHQQQHLVMSSGHLAGNIRSGTSASNGMHMMHSPHHLQVHNNSNSNSMHHHMNLMQRQQQQQPHHLMQQGGGLQVHSVDMHHSMMMNSQQRLQYHHHHSSNSNNNTNNSNDHHQTSLTQSPPPVRTIGSICLSVEDEAVTSTSNALSPHRLPTMNHSSSSPPPPSTPHKSVQTTDNQQHEHSSSTSAAIVSSSKDASSSPSVKNKSLIESTTPDLMAGKRDDVASHLSVSLPHNKNINNSNSDLTDSTNNIIRNENDINNNTPKATTRTSTNSSKHESHLSTLLSDPKAPSTLNNSASTAQSLTSAHHYSPLFDAIQSCNMIALEQLINATRSQSGDLGVRELVNQCIDDMTPLRLALSIPAPTNHVRMLLDAGADVLSIGGADSAILLAARTSHHNSDTIQLLVEIGADVNSANKFGNTALMVAACREECDVLKVLLRAGSDVNAVNNSGSTALSLAVQKGSAGCAMLLIEAGAKAYTVDAYAKSPIQHAAKEGNVRLLEALLFSCMPIFLGSNVQQVQQTASMLIENPDQLALPLVFQVHSAAESASFYQKQQQQMNNSATTVQSDGHIELQQSTHFPLSSLHSSQHESRLNRDNSSLTNNGVLLSIDVARHNDVEIQHKTEDHDKAVLVDNSSNINTTVDTSIPPSYSSTTAVAAAVPDLNMSPVKKERVDTVVDGIEVLVSGETLPPSSHLDFDSSQDFKSKLNEAINKDKIKQPNKQQQQQQHSLISSGGGMATDTNEERICS